MRSWFYLVKGRPHGPVPTATIEQEIKARQLNARDLIYRERDTLWREVASFAEFSHLFKNEVSTTSSGSGAISEVAKSVFENHWVLLVRKPDGSGYKQRGPFATSEIVRLLNHDEIQQTDYVWREGLKEWYKILAVGEIQEMLQGRKEDSSTESSPNLVTMPPLPPLNPESNKSIHFSTDPGQQVISGLTEIEEATTPSPPVKRSEFVNKATVVAEKSLDAVTNEGQREVRKGKKRPTRNEAKGARVSLIRYFLDLTPVNKAIFISGSIAFLVAVLGVSLWMSSYQDRKNIQLKPPQMAEIPPLPMMPSQPVGPPPKVAASEPYSPPAIENPRAPPQAAVEAPPAKSAPEVKRAPGRIQIERQGNGTENLVLKINSDGSSNYAILVTIDSVLGQVLEVPSVYVRHVIRSLEDRAFEVKKLRLPIGQYHVTVESESVKAATTIDFGTNARDFRARLNSHRKHLSYDHNEERHGLIKVLGRFESETFKFAQSLDAAGELRSWTDFYRSWRKSFDRIQSPFLSEVSARNRQKFVHASAWLQLKDLRSQIDREAKLVNKSKVEKRAASSAHIRAMALNLSQMKEQAIQASLWK